VTYVTPLQPLSEAIYGVLQSTALLALLSSDPAGGVQTDIPENPVFPFLWVELIETRQRGGFGTKPGTKTLPEIEVRLHVYSQFAGDAEAHGILSQAIADLSVTDALVVTGYRMCTTEPFHDSTITSRDELLNNIKVHEYISSHRIYVEET
jgi:hypothetical protein